MKLLVVGDIHYPSFLETETDSIAIRKTFYTPFFNALAAEQADCVLFLGDISNEGTLPEIQFLASLTKKIAPVSLIAAGNHDTHACTTAQFFAAINQPRYCRVDFPQVSLLVLDTTLESCTTDWRGILDAEQRNWLIEQVQSVKNKTLCLAAHHPVANTTRRSDEQRLQIEPQADMWGILNLKKSGVFVNGHNHYHSIVRQNGWLFVQTGDVPSHTDYRIFDFDGSNLTVTTKSLAQSMTGASVLAKKMNRYTLYTNLHYAETELFWKGTLDD